ncbi:MAG: DUF3780 domain-containing protein [Rhodopila sp.]|jgi:hypothetical protein
MAARHAVTARVTSRRDVAHLPVDASIAVREARTRARMADTVGFGCPPLSDWPHHFVVDIPAGRGGDIRITENHGILGHALNAESVERCVLSRERWNALAAPAKAELNARLRDKGLPTGRWQPGANLIERILGTEVLILAWAVTAADEADVAAVVAAWVALQPMERLWLAGRVLANPSADRVRRGIALMLSAGPAKVDPEDKAGPTAKSVDALPLFSGR